MLTVLSSLLSSFALVLPLIVLLLVADLSFGEKASLRPHKAISITKKEDFTKPGVGQGCECITGGSGTSGAPYIIENWDIETPQSYGISVIGTKSYFVVRNVKVHGIERATLSGIYFEDVQDAKIEGTTVTNNKGSGIVLHNSRNNKLIGNTVKDNTGLGIGLFEWSKNNTLEGNVVTGNNWGIRLEVSDSNSLKANTVTGNKLGMFLRGSGNVYVGNTIKGNSELGINIDTSRDSTFAKNTVCGNKFYGIALYSSKKMVIDENTVCDNDGGGIYLELSTDNLLKNNKITGNKGDAILLGTGSQRTNRLINNTVEDKAGSKAGGNGSGSPSSGKAK